jgi:hypothetical protein
MVKAENMERLCQIPLEEVLPAIREPASSRDRVKVVIRGYKLNAQSLRLRTFKNKGTICCACGLAASYFVIEKVKASNEAPHLNLYGLKDGVEILFTHDHTLARGLGGSNHISNSQPMCGPCNWAKGLEEQNQVLTLQGKWVKIKESL